MYGVKPFRYKPNLWLTPQAGSECEPVLNNQNVSSRLSKFAPPAISILAALVIFALSLGTYCLHYFPYEDDFSLIRYSAAQNSPSPVTWITKGFSEYSRQ